MVKVSIHDDKPYVFFNQTLFGLSFIFNDHKYLSVRECYNCNKTINMWLPETIPVQQRLNIKPDYFVIDSYGNCFCRDNMSYIQFDTYVQAYLFRTYFEQVKDCVDELELFRHMNAYKACLSVIDNVKITKDTVILTEYDRMIYCDEVILNVSKKSNGINLSNMRVVHIGCNSLLNIKNIKVWVECNGSCVFNVYLGERIDDIPYQVLLLSNYSNVNIIEDKLNMNCGKKIVSVGNIEDNCDIDWNSLTILDGDL